MRKRISILLCMVTVIVFGVTQGGVTAQMIVPQKEYHVTYSFSPIMNTEYIKDLSKQENAVFTYTTGNMNVVEYEANQLVQMREYDNGLIEKDYVLTKVAEMSERNTETSFTRNRSGFTLTLTMYYTVRGTYRDYEYSLSQIKSTVTRTSFGSVRVTEGSHAYRLNRDIWRREDFYFNNSSLGMSQSFSMYTGNSGFYESHPDLLTASVAGVYADSSIDMSDGNFITINLAPKEEAE